MIEQRPLTTSIDSAGSVEPRLELVPALDDPEAVELEPAVEEAAEAEETPAAEELEALEGALQAQDPLKLYVRAIGDGRLLTPVEERELARRKDEGDEAAKRKLI